MPDLRRTLDLTHRQWEQKVLELLQTEWATAGNIKVNTFTLYRLLHSRNEITLPAIIVHISPIRYHAIVGGIIPYAELTVWGVVPFVGDPEQRRALELMSSRLAGILLQHFKVDGYWNEIRLGETRILNANEQPPRWEACQVRAEIWGLPVTFYD